MGSQSDSAPLNCDCGEYHDLKCPEAKMLRNCWCTPEWLAELIGWVVLDPCSNSRSHIRAGCVCVEGVNDGLDYRPYPHWTVFINPPYANGQVIKWVRHYSHTRFIFLLRWDPSTVWYEELLPKCTHVWFPPCRIDFEPPPRIRASSNPYPHALFLRDPPDGLLERLNVAGYLLTVDGGRLRTHTAANELRQSPSGSGTSGEGAGRARGGRSGVSEDSGLGPTWTNPKPEATKRHYRLGQEKRQRKGKRVDAGPPAAGVAWCTGTEGDPRGTEAEGDGRSVCSC